MIEVPNRHTDFIEKSIFSVNTHARVIREIEEKNSRQLFYSLVTSRRSYLFIITIIFRYYYADINDYRKIRETSLRYHPKNDFLHSERVTDAECKFLEDLEM